MDINYAIRQIIKRPVYYFVIIMSLAVGMGINTIIYSLYDISYSKKLPREVKNQDSLVWLNNYNKAYSLSSSISYREHLEYKENNTVFSGIIASGYSKTSVMRSDGMANKINVQDVSDDFFNVLGIKPLAGRVFNPGDERSEQNYAIVSYRFWKARFNGEPSVVGKEIFIGNTPYIIIGVLPKRVENIAYIGRLDAYAVLKNYKIENQMTALARLRDGVNISQAGAEMSVRFAQLKQAYPDIGKDLEIRITSVLDGKPVNLVKGATAILLLIIVLVMLVPCINVASLLLNRAVARMDMPKLQICKS